MNSNRDPVPIMRRDPVLILCAMLCPLQIWLTFTGVLMLALVFLVYDLAAWLFGVPARLWNRKGAA